jgi:hypothetical protein
MLHLILSHRDGIGPIQQDVRGLQHGVVEESRHHTLLSLRFVLELRLPLQLSDGRNGVEDPRELGVLRHVRLDEHGTFLRVEAGREQRDRHIDRAAAEIRWLVRHGDGVVVDDAEDAFVAMLKLDPILHRPEVVADVQLPRRLNSAENSRHHGKL